MNPLLAIAAWLYLVTPMWLTNLLSRSIGAEGSEFADAVGRAASSQAQRQYRRIYRRSTRAARKAARQPCGHVHGQILADEDMITATDTTTFNGLDSWEF